jgi:hypothetical protein
MTAEINAQIWGLLRRLYGENLISAFVLVTSLNDSEIKQESLLVLPTDGKAQECEK